MATQEKTWKVANRLHSQKDSDNPEVNHIIAGADEIYDDAKGAKQSDINAQVDAAIGDRYTKEETYSKEQLDDLITTPDVNYVSVVATNATTAVTDILPATGEANTIYRVGNWNGTQYDPTMYAFYAWNGSAYVCLAVRSFVGEVYDISVNHPDGQGNPTPYADLTAALGTNGANIPADIRRGGISIKFIQGTVQSSDNKYVQYRLMADSWSIDTNDWSFCGDDVLVENPEWMYVLLDSQKRILAGLKSDGSVEWSIGVPTPVKEYVTERLAEIMADVETKVDKEDGKSLVDSEFAGGIYYVENPKFVDVKTDAEGKILWAIKNDGDIYYGAGVPQQVKDYIEDLLDEKVDKEEGKSLIDSEYASTKSAIDNPKFLDVTLDAENKILEGIQVDGTKVISGDVNVGGSAKILGNMEVSGVSYRVIESPEYIAAWVDAEDKVIFGFKTDGKTYVGDADFLDDIESIKAFLANFSDKNIDWDALTSITATENPELIEAKIDSEGKLLAGRTFDGEAFEKVGFSTPKVSIDGATIENIEDPEKRSEITTDTEGKIISYRDSEGMKHEEVGINSAVVNTNSLNLTTEGMTEFQQALKNAGFKPGGNGDWSDYISNDGDSPLEIAIPRCAHLNLLTDFNLVNLKKAYYNGSIKGVNYDIPIEVEFFDMQGNYFKKKAFISGQGRSTMNRDKKNIAIDLFDSDWDDDAFAIRFGDWVPQDSFHLKAYANEAFNANGTWAYKIYDAMSKSWGIEYDYLYKRALLDMSQNTSVKAYGTEASDNAKFEDTGAKCFPDGFPVIVYQNGEFWGVFAWQLKKHRDNYKMKKSEPKHIHLDGIINTNVWDTNGAPEWWTLEVRNPKDVVYSSAHFDSVTGKYTYKYDGDLSQENIAGNQQWSSVHEYSIDYVVEWDGKRYKSLQNANTGNEPSAVSEYWSVDSETPYDLWVSGTSYPQNKVIEHNGHRFINSVADNTEEPIIDSERGINTDKAPDFKNKTGCGWINCTNTIKVKNYIINMSRIMTKIKEKEDVYLADTSAENLQELKDTFETYFDVDNLVDYLIINDIINNPDAFASNWQWLTYDGVKWWCGLYDCNISFGYEGGQYTTQNFRAPLTNHVGNSSNYMMRYIKTYYSTELEARYTFLRRNNVVTAEKIVYDIIIDWTNAVGYVNYAKEREKWPGEVSVDNIYRLKKWVYETIANLDILYRYSNI